MIDRTKLAKAITFLWIILMGTLVGVARENGEASSGEFAIGLMLWYDIAMRTFDRFDRIDGR